MTNEEKMSKRVALASDVIAQLRDRKIRPSWSSGYCVPNLDKGYCSVCATGALVVACCGAPQSRLYEDGVIDCLKELFSVDELAVIEAAFEGETQKPLHSLTSGQPENEREIEAAAELFGSFEDEGGERIAHTTGPTERVRKIMRNIITNNGEFRP